MKSKLKIFAAALCFIVIGCSRRPEGNKIQIENKLNKNIICLLGYNYPDLTFKFLDKRILKNLPQFAVSPKETKAIDTLGLCDKQIWDTHIHYNLLMLFVFDKDKVLAGATLEGALINRYYFSYFQVMNTNGVIKVD